MLKSGSYYLKPTYPPQRQIMEKLTNRYYGDISSGSYECADCGFKIRGLFNLAIPTCPIFFNTPHIKKFWIKIEGQKIVHSPYRR